MQNQLPKIISYDRKERERLTAMKRYLTLSVNQQNKLDDIAMLATKVTNTPVALISLIDKDTQLVTSKFGYEITTLPRANSFCTRTIEQEKILVVKDSKLDERFQNNPIVNADPAARFYAGMPLKSYDGYNVGTLCVLDVKPKSLSKKQAECLEALARQATSLMELHLNINLLKDSIAQIEARNTTLKQIAHFQSHEFRGPLTSVLSVMNLIKDEDYPAKKEYMLMLESAVNKLDEKICSIVEMASVPAQAATK